MTQQSSTYKSEALAAVHETAQGLYEAGVINKRTMRDFDATCLTPVRPLTPDEIRALRRREDVSQAVFAHYLNVTTDYVSKWERGLKAPSGGTLKLLMLVQRKGLDAIA